MHLNQTIINPNETKNFLTLSYDELEEKNLEMKEFRKAFKPQSFFKERILQYLKEERRIKAVNVCFSDLEGKLLSVDYDKNYIMRNNEELTFDGSSIRGFSTQDKSDLILTLDWTSFRWLPADIFGPGKVLLFANVADKSRVQYESDFRGILNSFAETLYKENYTTFNIAPEIEGFLINGIDAEQHFSTSNEFQAVTIGGYYNSLPQDPLRVFIDTVAEAQRAMGFENEKDHPEVAPSQFELNYKYTTPVEACDQIQLYKLLCRQVAKKMGYTASFIPKPFTDINGSGMHINISASQKDINLFYSDQIKMLSDFGTKFATAILYYAKDICLILNSSVNSYRRLDPRFEAPNEIKMSSCDRGSMIRIPLGSNHTTRLEVRSVAPDCNPYLSIFVLLKIGMLGTESEDDKFKGILEKRERLPGNIYDALRYFKGSNLLKEILVESVYTKFAILKETVANRCPKDLGSLIKAEEIIHHHEVTNQLLWHRF